MNPNPARFDLKKAEAINADHLRALPPEDFLERTRPYLQGADLVSDPLTDHQRSVLEFILPHVQPRVGLLGEVPDMVAFLFTADSDVVITEDARKTLGDNSREVLERALEVLHPLDKWSTDDLQDVLRVALVEGMELSPRHAFTPLRVAVSGRRVSPPLFESMEILGKASTLARLQSLRDTL